VRGFLSRKFRDHKSLAITISAVRYVLNPKSATVKSIAKDLGCSRQTLHEAIARVRKMVPWLGDTNTL
jgi:hypothetical protein